MCIRDRTKPQYCKHPGNKTAYGKPQSCKREHDNIYGKLQLPDTPEDNQWFNQGYIYTQETLRETLWVAHTAAENCSREEGYNDNSLENNKSKTGWQRRHKTIRSRAFFYRTLYHISRVW